MGTWLDTSEGAPDPGMPELRWPHTAGDSAGSPLHHDEEEMDLQERDGFAGVNQSLQVKSVKNVSTKVLSLFMTNFLQDALMARLTIKLKPTLAILFV